jgi:hypothetical protein
MSRRQVRGPQVMARWNADFHDREGFSTPCGTKSFAIMKVSEM